MKEYREVEGLFSGLDQYKVASRSLIEGPYKDGDEVLIEAQILETLDDGMEIELCLWTDCGWHLSFWDVSIEKGIFDSKAEIDFLSYLRDKGIYLENVKDKYGRWRYCGEKTKEKVYRIQYYEEEDD